MKILIDADVWCHRASVRCEEYIEWPGGLCTLHSHLPTAITAFKEDIEHLVKQVGGNMRDAVLCYSDKENWRKRENPGYKANRKDIRKPLVFHALKDWCIENLPVVIRPGLEADDVMGLLARDTDEPETLIVTIDKDLLTIPGWSFNPDKNLAPIYTSLAEADAWFWTQALTGDPVDGYPGCKGVGAKTAARLLENVDLTDPAEAWDTILAAYLKKGHTEEFAVSMARMARITRPGDWDEDKEVMVWRPPVLVEADDEWLGFPGDDPLDSDRE